MRFKPSIPSVQSVQIGHWYVEHSPVLSVKWLQSLLNMELSFIDKKDPCVLNIHDESLVLKLDSDLGELAAKYTVNKNFNEIIFSTVAQRSAKRNWLYAHFLLQHHIATPEPLAYLRTTKMGLNDQSWYICRFEKGYSCEEYFLNSPSFTPSMRNTVSAIVEMFMALRECQLSHGNIKASNILILQNQPCLIDLDCMSYHGNKNKAEKKWRRDIQVFMENWWERHDIDKQFRLAFAKQGVDL
jgi:hypothetical protein